MISRKNMSIKFIFFADSLESFQITDVELVFRRRYARFHRLALSALG
jgi:hypothetical protein